MRYFRFALGSALTLCGGCIQLPTHSESEPRTLEAQGPRFDGGLVFGSGNRQAGATETTTTASADSTGRGGLVFGSGN
jgi:hypothetical protein